MQNWNEHTNEQTNNDVKQNKQQQTRSKAGENRILSMTGKNLQITKKDVKFVSIERPCKYTWQHVVMLKSVNCTERVSRVLSGLQTGSEPNRFFYRLTEKPTKPFSKKNWTVFNLKKVYIVPD